VAQAAARGRARLERGESVGETLRVFREEERLGAMGSITALRAIVPVGLGIAKALVAKAWGSDDFSHLGLADLAQLASLPSGTLEFHLRWAVIERRPWLLVVPDEHGGIRFFSAREADPSRAGTRSGRFVEWRNEIRALVGDERWRDEVEIVRDEPDAILVRFLKVRD
jgi:hypothetical protein